MKERINERKNKRVNQFKKEEDIKIIIKSCLISFSSIRIK